MSTTPNTPEQNPEPVEAPAASAGDDTTVTDLETLTRALNEAQARAKEFEDSYLRARAEMENIRRRSAQDALNAGKFAIESFAESLIAVADSLDAALQVESPTLEALKAGTEITLKQLLQAFEKGKVMAINPVGEKFDPNRHMAVGMVPGESVDPPVAANHVVKVLQKGYLIHDRVLRPAMVMVAQSA